MKALVSVIIPTKNEEKFIGNTLESVVNQTYPNIEVIVVDSCSDDNTVRIAKKYADKVIIKKTNIAEGRNLGVKNANGEILTFIDADTVLPSNFIEKSVKVIQSNQIGCVIGRAKSLEKSKIGDIINLMNWIFTVFKLSYPCYMGVTVKRRLFEKVNGFNENLFYCEDVDFLRKISMTCKIAFPYDLVCFSSVRRWKGRYDEGIRCILRLIEYHIFKKTTKKFPIFHEPIKAVE
jgi:glycosyltransferase involved in cell wall biosynthesis